MVNPYLSAYGGNPPAPAFHQRGKRERGSSDFLAAAGSSRSRSASTFLSIPITNRYVDPARSAFPEVLLAPPTPLPCFYPHSKWAAIGPVHVGVRSQAQVHHHGDGTWVAGCCHLLGDLCRIIGLCAVTRTRRWMSLLTKLPDVCWPSRYQRMLAMRPPLASRMRLLGMGSALVECFLPWPTMLLPLSARHAAAAHTLLC